MIDLQPVIPSIGPANGNCSTCPRCPEPFRLRPVPGASRVFRKGVIGVA